MRNLILGLLLLSSAAAFGQGFGAASKTKVTLHRVLPPAISLPGNSISLVLESTPEMKSEVDTVSSLLKTEALKYNKDLKFVDDPSSSPDVTYRIKMLALSMPPPVIKPKVEIVPGKLFSKDTDKTETRQVAQITGKLSASYEISDAKGNTLDADNIEASYNREFDVHSLNEQQHHSMIGAVVRSIPRPKGNKQEEHAPTTAELQQILAQQLSQMLALRIVKSDEQVEVMLARGKLEEANKLAQQNQWTRDLQTLEGMKPFDKPDEDAYRLYNIGVAYEALGYQAADYKTAMKLLDEAAANYGKAIDARPNEPNFIQPQSRIQTALVQYHKLEKGANAAKKKEITANVKTDAASDAPLTNADVIEMTKSGLADAEITEFIKTAKKVDFNLSMKGRMELAKNKVSPTVRAAMAARTTTTAARRTPKKASQ